jgi:hypothetical protein
MERSMLPARRGGASGNLFRKAHEGKIPNPEIPSERSEKPDNPKKIPNPKGPNPKKSLEHFK